MLCVSVSNEASAHFPVRDAKSGVSAIFHVTPDHDPITGKESVISFDFSGTKWPVERNDFRLTVTATKSEAVSVPIEVTGNVILASYVFPRQGFYSIRLQATDRQTGEVAMFEYGQRVSRGEAAPEPRSLTALEWGAIGGIGAVSLAAIIYSIMNDRRQQKRERE